MREFLQDYLAIGAGLFIGSAAHLGRMITEGRLPTWLQAVGYVLQLGLVGLVCSVATRKLGITDQDYRALSAAVMALSAQETLQLLKGWLRSHVTIKFHHEAPDMGVRVNVDLSKTDQAD